MVAFSISAFPGLSLSSRTFTGKKYTVFSDFISIVGIKVYVFFSKNVFTWLLNLDFSTRSGTFSPFICRKWVIKLVVILLLISMYCISNFRDSYISVFDNLFSIFGVPTFLGFGNPEIVYFVKFPVFFWIWYFYWIFLYFKLFFSIPIFLVFQKVFSVFQIFLFQFFCISNFFSILNFLYFNILVFLSLFRGVFSLPLFKPPL